MFEEASVSQLSKVQSIIALSTYEAEYDAMWEAGKEVVWQRYLLDELGFRKQSIPITSYAGNQGSIGLSNNSKFHQSTNHIEVQFHQIWEVVSMKQVYIV